MRLCGNRRNGCGLPVAIDGTHAVDSIINDSSEHRATCTNRSDGRRGHRHQEFLRFLKHLDAAYPVDEDLHLIVDNYGTHTHFVVREWLAAHPRFKLHFTPTSSSWLNLVERWFRELTEKNIRRGVFRSASELTRAIRAFIATYNDDPKPLVWIASAASIIKKVNRGKAILETLH